MSHSPKNKKNLQPWKRVVVFHHLVSCAATDVAPSLSRIYGCIQTWSESGSILAEDEPYEIYLTDEDVLESCPNLNAGENRAAASSRKHAVDVRLAAPLLLLL